MPKKRKKSSPESSNTVTKSKKTQGRQGSKMATYNNANNINDNSQMCSASSIHTPVQHQNGIQASQLLNGQQTPQYGNQQFVAMNPASPSFSPYSLSAQMSPINMNTQQNMDIFGMLNSLIRKVDLMDNKLSQLDAIQTSVSGLSVKMSSFDQKISVMEKKIEDFEQSRQFDSGMMEDMNKKQQELENCISKFNQHQNEQQRRETDFKRELNDLKCRSMRDNLLFYNLPEEKDENCEAKILEFIESKLEIENAKSDIKLHRAHRIGEYKREKVRPIVAKFAFYPDSEKVRKLSHKLKGSPFGISEQFPKEIMETRRKLIPIMKKAREEGNEVRMSVDRLFINGREYKGES